MAEARKVYSIPAMKRTFHSLGALTCLLAIFLSAGGHWATLQSIAWTRMLVEFAQEDCFSVALKKTFDGEHSCSLCPKIRDGYSKERKSPATVSGERLPEFVAHSGGLLLFTLTRAVDVPFVPSRWVDFCVAPPTPPPRFV